MQILRTHRQTKKNITTFLLLSFLLTALPVYSQTSGLVNELQNVIKETRSSLEEKYKQLKDANAIEYNPTVPLIKSSNLHPLFISSLLLHTSEQYQYMMKQNSCYFYSLLGSGALKNSLGNIDHLLIITKGVENKTREVLIPTSKYLQIIYQFKCKSDAELSRLFNKESLIKTINSLKLETPRNKKQCQEILTKWRTNSYLPYLCSVPQKIDNGNRASQLLKRNNIPLVQLRRLKEQERSGEYLLKNISYQKRFYLKNLCDSIAQNDTFCEPYLATDAWSKVINGEIEQYHLKFNCLDLYNKSSKDTLSKKELRECVQTLRTKPSICSSLKSKGFNELSPKPDCQALSKALIITRLKVPYRDCPARISNSSLTNIHRIGQHFDLGLSDLKLGEPDNCDTYAYESLANIFIENKNQENWPLRLCYFDKIDNKEVCKFYIPGVHHNSEYREEKVITDILYRLGKISKSIKCQLASQKSYNPVFLRFKSGCHIIKNDQDCHGTYCQRRIIINEKQDNSIKHVGQIAFDYFPLQWKNQSYSISSILNERYNLKSKKLLNLTQLEYFLKGNPNAIVHGIGCAEDILPQFFRRQRLNQCKPLSFIIDGILQSQGNKVLSVRTALDSIHHPRLIFWNFIFTAIMNYQNLHPLNTWILYGLSK